MRESHRLMSRLLLAALLLWGQAAFSAHELDDLGSGHIHSADCAACFSGHFHAATMEQAPLVSPSRAGVAARSDYQFVPYTTTLRYGAIRAPPTALK